MMKHFGEVIESSLSSWKVHCWKWDSMPAFGSLVVTLQEHIKLFGIVTQVTTGSIDASRYPFPYQKTEEELHREQPQIFALLQTHVSCLTLGYKEHTNMYYQLAPRPPKIHAFVRLADHEELQLFFAEALYVHLLCGASQNLFSLDELLLALLKQLFHNNLLTPTHIDTFIATLSIIAGNDYRKLKLFLQRLEKLIGQVQQASEYTLSSLI